MQHCKLRLPPAQLPGTSAAKLGRHLSAPLLSSYSTVEVPATILIWWPFRGLPPLSSELCLTDLQAQPRSSLSKMESNCTACHLDGVQVSGSLSQAGSSGAISQADLKFYRLALNALGMCICTPSRRLLWELAFHTDVRSLAACIEGFTSG